MMRIGRQMMMMIGLSKLQRKRQDQEIKIHYCKIFTDDGRHALQVAPGEKNRPVSLFLDQNSEEKSFPVLFAGQKRTDNEDRKVPVTLIWNNM